MNKKFNNAGQFSGKIGMVTGGTQGLGEAVVRRMLDEGATGVAFCGRNATLGTRLAADLGARACYVQADLEKVEDCTNFVDEAVKRFGRVDAVVSCGASTKRGSIEDTSKETWDHLFNTNVRGAFFVIQRAVLDMKKRKQPGAVAIVGSMQAHGGAPFLLPYATTKGALMTLTKGMGNALLWDRIRVNMINIGWTNTPNEHLVQTKVHGRPENWLEQVGLLQPYGRLIEVEEAAKAILFMVSNESGMMSGSIIDFDQQVIGTMRDNPGV
jgi:short-subunit dehydrogenase